MRILIAPQEFKGTLTAAEAARAMADGLARAVPSLDLDIAPIADGGPGTVDAILEALGGERREARVCDPLGRSIRASWALVDQGRTGVIEMAAASGLWRLAPGELDPLRASSLGSGQLLLAALEAGCRRVLFGLGGSATNDGGAGAASALGIAFLDAAGASLLPGGAALARLARIDMRGRNPGLDGLELLLLADVDNPLLGSTGASATYGPQKGADRAAVSELEDALTQLERTVRSQLELDLARIPGAGAAGGVGYGLMALAKGRLVPGFSTVAEAMKLRERLSRCDLVLTGEGRLDAQTDFGKGPAALARLARSLGKRTVSFAGSVAPGHDAQRSGFDEVQVVTRSSAGPASATLAGVHLAQTVSAWARAQRWG